jgi:hypothetical protein
MKLKNSIIAILMIALCVGMNLPAQSQFVALARKIKSKSSEGSQISSVVLDAKPGRVYKAMIDTLDASPRFKVMSRDDTKRIVMAASGSSNLNFKVDSLDVVYSKISVAARDEEQDPQQVQQKAVNAILAICHKLGIKCSVEK